MLPKGDLADQFKPVVPWPHVEGVEVDLNSIRLKHGESIFFEAGAGVKETCHFTGADMHNLYFYDMYLQGVFARY